VTRFAFIDREKALYDNISVLCRLLKVSRSGFLRLGGSPAPALGPLPMMC
jgi:hypothetical protein